MNDDPTNELGELPRATTRPPSCCARCCTARRTPSSPARTATPGSGRRSTRRRRARGRRTGRRHARSRRCWPPRPPWSSSRPAGTARRPVAAHRPPAQPAAGVLAADRGQRRPRDPRLRAARLRGGPPAGAGGALPRVPPQHGSGGRRQGRAGRDDRAHRRPARPRLHPALRPRSPIEVRAHVTDTSIALDLSRAPRPAGPATPADAEAAVQQLVWTATAAAAVAAPAAQQPRTVTITVAGATPAPLRPRPARPAAEPHRRPRPPRPGVDRPVRGPGVARAAPSRPAGTARTSAGPQVRVVLRNDAGVTSGTPSSPCSAPTPREAARRRGEGPARPVVDLRLAHHAAGHLHALLRAPARSARRHPGPDRLPARHLVGPQDLRREVGDHPASTPPPDRSVRRQAQRPSRTESTASAAAPADDERSTPAPAGRRQRPRRSAPPALPARPRPRGRRRPTAPRRPAREPAPAAGARPRAGPARAPSRPPPRRPRCASSA